ncbi:MAG: NADH-quinone oxidoreductase subunit E, partial [Verrucomicrobiota bacterium]
MPTSASNAFERFVSECEARYAERHPEKDIRVQVGSATCENAAGARDVAEEFRKHIEASGRGDVDLRQTGCTGNCGSEPVVGVFVPGEMPVKYRSVDREAAHKIFTSHIQGGEPVQELMLAGTVASTHYQVLFCSGDRCGRNLDWDPKDVLQKQLRAQDIDSGRIGVTAANCFGLCGVERSGRAVHLLVMPANVMYRVSTEEEMEKLVRQQFAADKVAEDLVVDREPISQRFFDLYGDVAFLNRQSRVALRNAGVVDPERIEEYVHFDGFRALSQVLEANDPNSVIQSVLDSNLRGRGGGGFPTGKKWQFTAAAEEQRRILICNADEGDPGAFMDRDMLESDPFSVIEGMLIGGFAIGASEGYVYIRAEYPLAIRRLENAIEAAREHGLLGQQILGSDFSFDIEIRLGAGAFVCGEETALIHSIEGKRGQPRVRPPYPSEFGLWGYPTAINNVETLANVPAILLYSPQWFRRIGTERSGGTKVFALAG